MNLEMEIDTETFVKKRSQDDIVAIGTPYEAHNITLKSRRRRTMPASELSTLRCKEKFAAKKLAQAATYNDVDKLRDILCKSGVAILNASDELGRTALHIAASRGYAEVVEILLKAGADPNAEDKLGNTPLHLAVYTGSIETVSNLLGGGCRLRKTAKLPYTPLQLAQSKYLMLSKQECCVHPRSKAYQIIILLRRALESDLLNKVSSEARKKELESLLSGLANIELDDSRVNEES